MYGHCDTLCERVYDRTLVRFVGLLGGNTECITAHNHVPHLLRSLTVPRTPVLMCVPG